MKKTNVTKLIIKIINNKVVMYMVSRYITYALQFIASMIIAFKLGPESFGVWSFILLLINIFNIVDFGISNSLNILLVQDKNDLCKYSKHITSALTVTFAMSMMVLFLCLFARVTHPSFISKYEGVSQLLWIVAFIVIVGYFNKVFSAISRVENKLLEISIYQSAIPVLLFCTSLFTNENSLYLLVLSYLVAHSIALIVFGTRSNMPMIKGIAVKEVCSLVSKGIWLFLYNGAFYLIMYLTSMCVSLCYSVSDFGKYIFSYTVAHSLILMIDSFGYIVFPKMIDKLKSNNSEETNQTINYIRNNYITLLHLLIYLALPFFSVLCKFMNQYSDATTTMCLAAISLLPYSCAFGINTYLMAQNQERNLSKISLLCLLINIVFICLFAKYFRVEYSTIYVAIILTYTLFSLFCSFAYLKHSKVDRTILFAIKFAFPTPIIVPFLISIVTIFLFQYFEFILLLFIPFFVFSILNVKKIKNLFSLIKTVINKPNIVDLKNE